MLRPGIRRRGPRAAAGLALALALGAGVAGVAGGARAQEGPVASGDLLRLRVLDWDALAGEVVEWPEVSGDYLVGADGAIAVPFAGRIPSQGRSPDAIAADVVEGLRNRLALVEPPDATVEVAQSRPVIVTGDVRTPGAYDFVPGLLAAQAVALAGGAGPAVGSDVLLRREVATAQATLAGLRGQELRQIARQARLEAELAGQAEVAVAAPPAGAEWESVLAQERQLLRIRADRLARELAAIDEQVALLRAEIEALERKSDTLDEQLALATQAATDAESLASQGLVANQRLLDSAQVRAGVENQLLDVSTAILEARQNVAEAERERIGLQDARVAEVLEQRQQVDGQLADTRARIAGQVAVLEALGAGAALGGGEPAVAILRPEGGGLRRIEDAALLPVQPGDMVEVTAPALDAGAAATGPLLAGGEEGTVRDPSGVPASSASSAPEPAAIPAAPASVPVPVTASGATPGGDAEAAAPTPSRAVEPGEEAGGEQAGGLGPLDLDASVGVAADPEPEALSVPDAPSAANAPIDRTGSTSARAQPMSEAPASPVARPG